MSELYPWWWPGPAPHVITAHHRGGLTQITCWCGHDLRVPTDKHGTAITKHRVDVGALRYGPAARP